jgi:hypothetical protein
MQFDSSFVLANKDTPLYLLRHLLVDGLLPNLLGKFLEGQAIFRQDVLFTRDLFKLVQQYIGKNGAIVISAEMAGVVLNGEEVGKCRW